MKLSYWEWNSFFKNIDIAIIGSGIVGLSAAIHLKTSKPQLNIVVLERGILPSGASTRNAGFACFGSVSELLYDLSQQSESVVFNLLEKRWKGLQKMKNNLGAKNIQYQALGAYELFTQNDQTSFEHCIDKINYLNTMIKEITGERQTFSIQDETIPSFGFHQIKHLIYNQSEGQIDTGAMMNIKARKVLVATNGFAQQLLPNVELQPARNQVLITKPIDGLKLKGCFHYNKGYVYFRNIHNRILLGGGRDLNPEQEQTDTFGITDDIQKYLTGLLSAYFLPNQVVEIDRWWSGILGVGNTKTPIIKKASAKIAVAVRLGGMGVAIGMLVGEEGGALLL